MKDVQVAPNGLEASQLAALPIQEADFDDICHLASEICHSPVQLISIIDRDKQWFRAKHPLITADLASDFAFCNQAQHHPGEVFMISDLQKDYRFGNHLLVTAVPYAAFYTGIPLVNAEGHIHGTLCIWDNKPRELTSAQLTALKALARRIALNIDLKKKVAQLLQKQAEMQTAYADLENFTTIAAHDLKSPLNAMISLTDLLKNNYATALDEEGNEYIAFLYTAAHNLADLVTSVLNYSRSSQLLTTQKEDVNFTELAREIISLLHIPANASVTYDTTGKVIKANRTALKQILMNLLDNAVRYNDKERINVEIELCEVPASYTIQVKDNGTGIPVEERERIFELFKRLKSKIKEGKGMGIGLAIVKRLTEKLGGNITVESELAKGTSFVVTLPR